MRRNAIKKQVLLGGRKISGELSRVTMGESWSLKRKTRFGAPQEHPDNVPEKQQQEETRDDHGSHQERIKSHSTSSSTPLSGRNAVKKQMFRKVSRSISMMSQSVAPPPDESEEADEEVVAAVPRSKSTMTNSLQIPSVFERSVSVCEESVNSARKMLEDLFGRRAPPPSPQCSVVEGKKLSVLSDAVFLDQGPNSIENYWLEF